MQIETKRLILRDFEPDDFSFYVLKIHRLQAYCHEHNKASEKIMIKIGMKKEGELKNVRHLQDTWYSMLIYSIIDTDLGIKNL